MIENKQVPAVARRMNEVVEMAAPLFVRGEGALLYDEHGAEYLNLNELNVVLGENNRNYVQTMEQALASPLTASGHSVYKRKLIGYLSQTTEGVFNDVHFTSSGSEAVEWAVRLAQKMTGRSEIVCFWHSIHGRTWMSAGMSGIPRRKSGYGPVPAGIVYVPYPICGICPYHSMQPDCGLACIRFLEDTVEYASAHDIAAVIIEPLQASNIQSVPAGYLKALREWTRQRGIFLILDEVQSGMGRTGKLYCYQQEGVVPDILLLGKALGNGQHIAALLLTQTPDKRFTQAIGGGTGDFPHACAAACAVFEELLDRGLLEHVSSVGSFLMESLLELKQQFQSQIHEVRGKGLAIAIQFSGNTTASRVYEGLDSANILYGKDTNTVILKPPYSLTRDQADRFTRMLKELLSINN